MIIANLALRTSLLSNHLIPNVALCISTGRMVRLQLYGWEEKTAKYRYTESNGQPIIPAASRRSILLDTHASPSIENNWMKTVRIVRLKELIIWLYCMSNLIGPLLGNILPHCTGTGGYCTVHAGRHGNKRQYKKLFSILACLGWPVRLAVELCMVLSTPRYTLLII